MKKLLAAAALLIGSAAMAAPTVEVGSGDWSNIPEMRRMVDSIDSDTVAYIHELVETGECKIQGQRANKLDMSVPFLVQFDANGQLQRLVIEQFGCAKAEGVLANALLKLIDRGGVRPTKGQREGWFRSEVSFSHS